VNEHDKINLDNGDHTTSEDHWVEWKKVCSADLCVAETASALRSFGSMQFAAYLKRYASRVGHYGSAMNVVEVRDAWHLLETFSRVGTTRKGKRYKDWLFQRAEDDSGRRLSALEGGASLLMRDVVRDYLRKEHAPAFMISMNKPLGLEGGSALTLEELLPDQVSPLDEMSEREWRALAHQHAGKVYPSLDTRERLVIWARASGLALNDPRLLKRTQCSGSLLYLVHRECIHRIGIEIKKEYSEETPSALIHFTCMMLEELVELISSHIVLEKGTVRFF